MTYNFIEEYDIIVIGAGHAGVEASLAATVLLGIGTKTANKTMLFVSVALYFASILFAGDPAWLAIQIPSMISTVLVLIGTLLL